MTITEMQIQRLVVAGMAGGFVTLERLRSEDTAAGRVPEVVAALEERTDDLRWQRKMREAFVEAIPRGLAAARLDALRHGRDDAYGLGLVDRFHRFDGVW